MQTVLRDSRRLDSSDFIPKSNSDIGKLIADDFFGVSLSTYNLGYTTIGAVPLSGVTDSTTLGSRFTASQSGTVTSIKVYTNLGASGTATLRVAIFSNGGGNTIGTLIASSSPVNVTNTSPQWIDVPISASVSGSTDYWLFAWGDASGFSSDFTYYADSNAISNTIVTAFGNSYPNWSTVGDGVNENYDLGYMSIYAVVEVASGGNDLISGSISGTSTVSGSIVAKGKLLGAINGTSATAGVISRRVSISATSNGVATVSGAMRGKLSVIGSTAGTSTVSGTLTPRTYIVGVSNGVSTATGVVRAKGKLIGISTATSTATAIGKGKGRLTALTNGTSTAVAIGKGKGKLIGVANGTSTATATSSSNTRIYGTANGSTSVSGLISAKGYILASVSGTSTTSANIGGKTRLIGSSVGQSSVSGSAKAFGYLNGQINGLSTATGIIRNKAKRRYIITS